MEWIEANPLPEVCRNCQEEDCYPCDYAQERWLPENPEELRNNLMRARLERLRRKWDLMTKSKAFPFGEGAPAEGNVINLRKTTTGHCEPVRTLAWQSPASAQPTVEFLDD